MDEKEMRIILLGKTGSGKSSLGNTIFGEEIFTVKSSSISETKDCEPQTKQINGQTIRLFDAPGIFDTEQNKSDLGEKFYNCVKDCAPGPHAFLLVFRVDRYTKQEQDVVKEILSYFSEEALKYTTVVFTYGDELDKGQKIEDWYNENEALRSLVQKCGGRCHVFDNRYWNNSQDSYRNNQVQVRELLRTINETVEKNKGGYYTNGFWKQLKHMKIKGVPLKYLLAALLGAAVAGGASALVAKFLFDASVSSAVIAGAVTSVGVGTVGVAGAVYALAPDEVGAAASSAGRKVGEVTSDAGRNMTKMVSGAVKNLTSCLTREGKSKTS